jgi:hypothetical protein
MTEEHPLLDPPEYDARSREIPSRLPEAPKGKHGPAPHHSCGAKAPDKAPARERSV